MAHEHTQPADYRFCPHCGTTMVPTSIDDTIRPKCPECGFVQYRDPAVAAAVVILDGNRVLMVRRGPGVARTGYWSLPAGFVNEDEDVRAAAARELKEETGLDARIEEVLHVGSNLEDPTKPTVAIWFAGEITGGNLQPNDDAEEVGWFSLDSLPQLAFPGDSEVLANLGGGS
ncbi:MAG: NUDIX domain-containing protein [Acidimicrobiia bacterium]